MLISTQYYRAPFPERHRWQDDFRRIAESGVDAVQLWVIWSWVEARPGEYRFEDYDELIALAEQAGLRVILSVIAEIHPLWLRREEPGSELIDWDDRPARSGERGEVHFGLTPGSCFDHPGVAQRQLQFIRTVAERYHQAPALWGWDVWNENRWNSGAVAPLCFCGHTLGRYRSWLEERYGDLDSLNRAWKRRYARWDEIDGPRLKGQPYTTPMAWMDFITWRSCEHGRLRAETVRAVDPVHPISLHGSDASAMHMEAPNAWALDRGNDWLFAPHVDAMGISNFPLYSAYAAHEECLRLSTRLLAASSASRQCGSGKLWLSELQGGAFSHTVDDRPHIPAANQQRWLWQAFGYGVEMTNFWCWRDEVFGVESGAHGLAGNEPEAAERLAALRKRRDICQRHRDLLDGYTPEFDRIGVLHSPDSYYHSFAASGSSALAREACEGAMHALLRAGYAPQVLKVHHLDQHLAGIDVLILPGVSVLSDAEAQRILAWVADGGQLWCEAECGAYSPEGFFREPSERFLTQALGTREGSRTASEAHQLDDTGLVLPACRWQQMITPAATSTTVASGNDEGAALIATPHGRGQVWQSASFTSRAFLRNGGDLPAIFQKTILHQAQPLLVPCQQDQAHQLTAISGSSGDQRLLVVFIPEGLTEATTIELRPGLFSGTLRDLSSGAEQSIQDNRIELSPTSDQHLVLSGPSVT